jgi:hypothetical protein
MQFVSVRGTVKDAGKPSLVSWGGTMKGNAARIQICRQETQGVTEECISERRLWTAVIVTAVEDWRSGPLRARREAQSFLFEDKADFETVCADADLDPVTLRARLLKIGQRVHMHGPWERPLAA